MRALGVNGSLFYSEIVDYASLTKLITHFREIPLSSGLKKTVEESLSRLERYPYSTSSAVIYQKLLDECLELFFTENGKQALFKLAYHKEAPDLETFAEGLYRIFISIHPLADCNGRAGRLYYEYLAEQNGLQTKTINLFNNDIDLFSELGELPNHLYLGQVLKLKLGQTTDENSLKQFILNVSKAYSNLYPGLWFP